MPPVSKRRPPNRRRRAAARHSGRRDGPDLDQVLEQLLADPAPLAFIAHASGLAEVLSHPDDGGVDPEEFLRTVEHAESPAAHALAAMLAVLAPQLTDHPIRAVSPPWLARIDDARVTRAIAMIDLSGDSDQIVVEVRLADGSLFTYFTLVDHDLGTVVKDAFALSADLDIVLKRWSEIDEPGVEMGEIPLADAGAKLQEALADTARLFDPPTSDSWPQSRPLLQWIVRLLPEGGRGWPRVEWTESDLARLATLIVKSARPRIGPDAQDVVETLIGYAATHALGDPLRWSARSTRIVLDWLVGHVDADEQWYRQVGDALRAIIRYAHAERGQAEMQTHRALLVVSEWDLERGEARLAAAMAALGDQAPMFALEPEARLRRLADDVGGDDILNGLSAGPMSSTAADLAGVPEDVRPKVREIIAILEPVVADFFDDPELRLAAISLLARAAEADPEIFRRSSSPAMTAAAATWIVAKVNDAFGRRRVGDMMTAFGVKGSASQRATTLLRALDLKWAGPYRSRLGDVQLLTSRYRRDVIEDRDEALEQLHGEASVQAHSAFPTSITTPDGRTVDIQHQPGLANELLEQMRPLLAADGIDLDDPETMPDRATLQAGLDRASERHNQALFTPVGARRTAALTLLRLFATAIAQGDDQAALDVLDRAQPESRDDRIPEVSAVIGAALGLVDEWLSGRAPEAPKDLAAGIRVPQQWRKVAKPAAEILALGTRDRAAESLGALIARQGGRPVLAGAMLAVALSAAAWAQRTGTPLSTLLPDIVR